MNKPMSEWEQLIKYEHGDDLISDKLMMFADWQSDHNTQQAETESLKTRIENLINNLAALEEFNDEKRAEIESLKNKLNYYTDINSEQRDMQAEIDKLKADKVKLIEALYNEHQPKCDYSIDYCPVCQFIKQMETEE